MKTIEIENPILLAIAKGVLEGMPTRSIAILRSPREETIRFFREGVLKSAQDMLANGKYTKQVIASVVLPLGQDAAEELFDLTNDPGREAECIEKLGTRLPLLIGDIAEIDGVRYLCLPQGWCVV